jgi:hypothetical protein
MVTHCVTRAMLVTEYVTHDSSQFEQFEHIQILSLILLLSQIEMQALSELVSQKLPRLHAHLEQTFCDISIIATDW